MNGADHAPGLVSYMTTQNVEVVRVALEDPNHAVGDGNHSLVLDIDDDFAGHFASGQMTSVTLIYDSSASGRTRQNFMAARQIIAAYSQQIGMLRLQLRGIDPAITQPIIVNDTDVASPSARALSILGVLPYLLVLIIFMGGFYLAIDATAGEREHNSLEPLLIQPVSRTQLVLGKLMATSVFSAVSLALFLTSLAVCIPLIPFQQLGMSLRIGVVACLQIFTVSVPLMLFGAALLTVAASFAKSYKEAQTYLTIVVLIPTLPLVITQLLNLQPSDALMLIPSISQASLIGDIIKSAPVSAARVALSMGSTTILAAALGWLAVQMYRRERILV